MQHSLMTNKSKQTTRSTFLTVPEGGLSAAGSVMLDWNISTRLENIHKAQEAGLLPSISDELRMRLLWLLDETTENTNFVTSLSAAESEVRPQSSAADVERHARRADIAAWYLGDGRPYLRHLLDGGAAADWTLPMSTQVSTTTAFSAIRGWLTIGYVVLLRAVEIDRSEGATASEKVDAYRFWLEHELAFSSSRESWLGFVLLGGTPSEASKVRRILKVDSNSGLLANRVWGATWDIFYTRMIDLVSQPPYNQVVPSPLVFVTDDAALPEAIESIHSLGFLRADEAPGRDFHSSRDDSIGADTIDDTVLRAEVQEIVLSYIQRINTRVVLKPQKVTDSVMSRARSLARRIEKRLGS